MLPRILDIANAFAAKDPATTSDSWTDQHETDWREFSAKLQRMFSPRQYLACLPEDDEAHQEYERQGHAASDRLDEAIKDAVAKDDFPLALIVSRHQISSMTNLFGGNHRLTLEAMFTQAQLLFSVGQLDNAATLIDLGMERLEDTGRSKDIEMAFFCRLLGTIHQSSGKYAKALEAYSIAVEISENVDAGVFVSSMRSVGRVHRALGQFKEARIVFEPLLRSARRTLDSDSSVLAETISEMGSILSESGEYKEAIALMSEALEIRRKHLPDGRDSVATTLHDLARTHEYVADMEAAQSYWKELGEFLDESHPDYLAIRNETVTSLIESDRIVEARALLRRTTVSVARTLGRQHPAFASVCENWGDILLLSDNLGAARRAYLRATTIREITLGTASPDFAAAQAGLARVELKLGNLDHAAQLLANASEIMQESVGIDHPAYGEVQSVLGECMLAKGHYERAFDAFLANLHTRERAFGKGHVRTALAKNNLGVAAFYRNQLRTAEPLFVAALEVSTAAYGQKHRQTRAVAANLAATLCRQERFDDAESIFSVLAANLSLVQAASRVDGARLLNLMGCLQHAKGDHETALATFRNAHQFASTELGEESLLAGIILQNEAASLAAIQQNDEAEASYKSSLAIMQSILGMTHPDTQTVNDNLEAIQTSRSTGDSLPGTTIFTLIAA